MESKGIDPAEFRGTQRQQWNIAASGWRKWSELIDTAASYVSERLVELAAIQPGSRVLDVAAGYGEPALTAARKAGPNGSVVATDISAEMLAYGRERAAAAGLENIEFVEADASSLDFPAGSFDAALSRFGIIFDPDGEGAAARVRGFLKQGARMAISSWGHARPGAVPGHSDRDRDAAARAPAATARDPGTALAPDPRSARRAARGRRLLRRRGRGGRGHVRRGIPPRSSRRSSGRSRRRSPRSSRHTRRRSRMRPGRRSPRPPLCEAMRTAR